MVLRSIEKKMNEVEQFKKILRKHGYSEKAIEAILKWYT